MPISVHAIWHLANTDGRPACGALLPATGHLLPAALETDPGPLTVCRLCQRAKASDPGKNRQDDR